MTRFASTNRSTSQLTRKLLILCFTILLVSIAVLAQQTATTAKRPLNHTDYDSWKTIQQQLLTRDAKFLGYALNAQDADGEVVIRNLASSQEWRHNRGHRSEAAPATPSDNEYEMDQEYGMDQGRGGGARGGGGGSAGLTFTADGKFALFQIFPTQKENEDAKKANTRAADMPQNAMGIMDLSNGKVERIERVRRFQVTEEGDYVAYLIEPKPEPAAQGRGTEPGTPPAGAAAGGGRQGAAAGGRQGAAAGRGGRGGAGGRTEYGVEMVVRNLVDKSQRTFADVLDLSLTRDGKNMVYTVSSRKPEGNGIFLIPVGSTGESKALLSGRGRYTRTTWNEKQTRMLFTSDKDDATATQPKFKIYQVDMANPTATELISTATPNFKSGYVIAGGGLSFSQDASRIFFGISQPGAAPETPEETPPATPAPAAATAAADEKVSADLWHWKDDFIQPMQKVRANQDANRSFSVSYNLATKKLTQLSDETLPQVTPQADGRWALGSDDRAYRIMVGYEQGNMNDYYLVNTDDGSRKKLLTKETSGISFSNTGKFGLHFDGKDWITISIPDGKEVNLTKNLGVNFYNENNDTPSTPSPYGGRGGGGGQWTKDDSYVLLNDRYDIWKVAPDGSGAKNLTEGVGRKEKITFSYISMRSPDSTERGIDPTQPMLLSAVNEWTRDTGFYRTKFDGGTPQKLMMGAKNHSNPTKAKNADVYMLTAATFNEFPDLLICGPNFDNMKKVTNANPQRANILWGTSELIRFKNTDGVQLSASLYKPENFDPKKKYPMMVYIYELLSNGVNNFVNPAPGTSINISYYVSNGYLVLEPDIVYNIGYPGPSAMKCVLPAIQSVVDKGFVDEKAIGIQGHSWGGYQIAYMVTQTNRFAAAEAGAPVSNMTSAYSGIRWGSGLPRQFQYEHTQSRIGANLWDATMLYIQNSPVFQANRVQTPLLILHNDGDDAVPWYQGIEYYLALRRLNKEVYLWVYNGEPHGLRKRVNMKDYTIRMQQFFDHKLKGAPMPEWMEKGIAFTDKDKEKERLKTAVFGETKKETKPETKK